MTKTAKRLEAYRRGVFAEWVAALALLVKGYRILDRRYRARGGEIDLVAKRGAMIAFIEVKARDRYEDAIESIDPSKQRRIGKAVDEWIRTHAPPAPTVFRGDAIIILPGRWPHHIEDAFDLPLD